MRTAIAVAIAGAMIAGAILIALRWEISASDNWVYRLDRWTGRTLACPLGGPVGSCREPGVGK